MRVEERLASDAARQTGAAAETRKTGQGAFDSGAAPSAGSDRLQLSSLAERIRGVLDDTATAHSARVQEVAAQLHAGRYRVDTAALGRVLASEILGG